MGSNQFLKRMADGLADPRHQELLYRLGVELLRMRPLHVGPPTDGLAEAVRKQREKAQR